MNSKDTHRLYDTIDTPISHERAVAIAGDLAEKGVQLVILHPCDDKQVSVTLHARVTNLPEQLVQTGCCRIYIS